jgi:hypothetical protein
MTNTQDQIDIWSQVSHLKYVTILHNAQHPESGQRLPVDSIDINAKAFEIKIHKSALEFLQKHANEGQTGSVRSRIEKNIKQGSLN